MKKCPPHTLFHRFPWQKKIINERQKRYRLIAREMQDDPMIIFLIDLWKNDKIKKITYQCSDSENKILKNITLDKLRDIINPKHPPTFFEVTTAILLSMEFYTML